MSFLDPARPIALAVAAPQADPSGQDGSIERMMVMTDDPETPEDSKLTLTKQKWAREGKFITGADHPARRGALPPASIW